MRRHKCLVLNSRLGNLVTFDITLKNLPNVGRDALRSGLGLLQLTQQRFFYLYSSCLHTANLLIKKIYVNPSNGAKGFAPSKHLEYVEGGNPLPPKVDEQFAKRPVVLTGFFPVNPEPHTSSRKTESLTNRAFSVRRRKPSRSSKRPLWHSESISLPRKAR